MCRMLQGGPAGAALHASSAAEADGDAAVFEDHRNLAASGNPDHPLELRLVGFDVDVPDRVLALRVILTGRGRVGSGVFSEDLDHRIVHRATSRTMITVSLETGCYDFFEV